MAFENGTATGPAALLAALANFLKTNADLVADAQQWVTAWQDSDSTDVVLRGPGLAATDAVYVGFHIFTDSVNDRHWLSLKGFTGVNAGATAYGEHVNPSPEVRVMLDTGPMEYWFVASGRRFMIVVKISTVFEAAYCGLFLPYATPLSYPYPMFIGGSAGAIGNFDYTPSSWRSTAPGHRHFVSPYSSNTPFSAPPNAWVCDPSGQWVALSHPILAGGVTQQAGFAPEMGFDVFGAEPNSIFRVPAHTIMARMREGYGGDYPLIPLQIVQRTPQDQSFGILDGAYKVPGFGNSSEDLVTIDGVDHLVVQNVFRTTFSDYWAMRLE